VDEIRQRFDADVERFTNLETGQSATVDAPLAMALIATGPSVGVSNATWIMRVCVGSVNHWCNAMDIAMNSA
jgi:tRNA (cmo5U34)-methyltransferase